MSRISKLLTQVNEADYVQNVMQFTMKNGWAREIYCRTPEEAIQKAKEKQTDKECTSVVAYTEAGTPGGKTQTVTHYKWHK